MKYEENEIDGKTCITVKSDGPKGTYIMMEKMLDDNGVTVFEGEINDHGDYSKVSYDDGTATRCVKFDRERNVLADVITYEGEEFENTDLTLSVYDHFGDFHKNFKSKSVDNHYFSDENFVMVSDNILDFYTTYGIEVKDMADEITEMEKVFIK